MKTHIDFETRSELDLKTVGVWRYAAHPSTEVLCLGWAVGDEKPNIYDDKDVRRPRDLQIWGAADLTLGAHNAAFEYAIWHHIMHKRHGWPALEDPARWDCTMARALVCGLPGKLEDLAAVLQLPHQKDLTGRQAMLKLSKPHGYDALGDAYYNEDHLLYAALYPYNSKDVELERAVDAALPPFSPEERKVWELDLLVNKRGVKLDTAFARAAAPLADRLVSDLNVRLRTLTNGYVDKATQIKQLRAWLGAQGVHTPSLDKRVLTDLLMRKDLPQVARDVIYIRRQVSKKTSVAKYAAALEVAGEGERGRGLLQYHAAHTGRWGGRLLQPQNFPKGFKADKQAEVLAAIEDDGIVPGTFAARYGVKSMDALSDSLRGLFIASPGKTFVCADFNAIEARVLFWAAGDADALGAYRRGASPYVDMARKIYNNPAITKESHPVEYDIGKRTILGCGYGLGAIRYRENIYIETAKLGAPVDIPESLAQTAVKSYREKYSSVVRMWYQTEAAAINAVKSPGQLFKCMGGRVTWGMSKDRRFLVCRLPSGRYLRYWKPEIHNVKTPWGEDKAALCYYGEDSATHLWGLITTYGGSLVENIIQAIARDLMAAAMLRVEAAGYDMLLTCHDEILSEIETHLADLKKFIALMCVVPDWAFGCPLAAEGFTGFRYHK